MRGFASLLLMAALCAPLLVFPKLQAEFLREELRHDGAMARIHAAKNAEEFFRREMSSILKNSAGEGKERTRNAAEAIAKGGKMAEEYFAKEGYECEVWWGGTSRSELKALAESCSSGGMKMCAKCGKAGEERADFEGRRIKAVSAVLWSNAGKTTISRNGFANYPGAPAYSSELAGIGMTLRRGGDCMIFLLEEGFG